METRTNRHKTHASLRAIVTGIVGLLVFVSSAHAGLSARKVVSKDFDITGDYPVCAPITVERTASFHIPPKAVHPRIEGPVVGDQYGSRTHDPAYPWEVLATIDSVSSRRSGKKMRIDFTMTVDKYNDTSCSPTEPYGQPGYEGYFWSVQPSAEISFGMRWRHRFKGSVVDYNGRRKGHNLLQGDYHALKFRDRLGLKTRYEVCVDGDIGESKCWKRSTDAKGVGKVDASLFINDHTAGGEISWRVDGKRVAYWHYVLIPEGI